MKLDYLTRSLKLGAVALAAAALSFAAQDLAPMKETAHRDSFQSGIGMISLVEYFDDLGMGGNIYVGPPVTLERELQGIPMGTRVVPVAVNFICTANGQYLGTTSFMSFRRADSSEGFERTARFHEPGTVAEVVIFLKDDLTWGEVDEESDIGLHQLMAPM